jgi:hypothetical protein
MPETREHRFAGKDDRAEERIETLLNYISEFSEKPVYHAFEPLPGIAPQSGEFASYSTPIRNGRAILDELSVDKPICPDAMWRCVCGSTSCPATWRKTRLCSIDCVN